MKSTLTFYTNIVSPYQLDFFEELSKHLSLRVVFYSRSENDRSWNLSVDDIGYEVIFLKTGILTKVIQKVMPSFHFSLDIFSVASSDKSDYVILGGNYFIPNTLVALLFSSLKSKSIYWFGERVFPSSPLKSFLKRILLQPIFIITDGILAVGQEGISSYQSYGYKKKCYNIPYNINDSKFKKDLLDNNALLKWRKKLNVGNKIIVLTSGSLIERKGMDNAIKSFQSISNKNKEVSELWILGDGELRSELELSAANEKNIKFLGFLQPSDIPFIFGLSDIFLFCSRYDGWGVVVNEALSAGLPVITSKQASSYELVRNGEAGYVHDCENVNKFSESLNILISDDNLRKELSLNARTISSEWNSSAIAKKVTNILKGRSDI